MVGELKKYEEFDTAKKAWFDVARYKREALGKQSFRRFALGFALSGKIMRVLSFDRTGVLASEAFDIHVESHKFVKVMLGFLGMSRHELGFHPEIQEITPEIANELPLPAQYYMDIMRDGQTERIYFTRLLSHTTSIVCRATECWEAYSSIDFDEDLAVKLQWHYPTRRHEGELLQLAQNIEHVAQYYHHDTRGSVHDFRGNLDISEENMTQIYDGRSLQAALTEREYRVVITRGVGTPICLARSRAVFLTAFRDCVIGHRSLLDISILHKDISLTNIMIDANDRGYLIDLDNAEWFVHPLPVAVGRTVTKIFLSIGVLRGGQHTFMDDLESFFWVMFWICVHYDGEKWIVNPNFETWNYESDFQLSLLKSDLVRLESGFEQIAKNNFTQSYQDMIPLMIKLRKRIFRDRAGRQDMALYDQICRILSTSIEQEMMRENEAESNV